MPSVTIELRPAVLTQVTTEDGRVDDVPVPLSEWCGDICGKCPFPKGQDADAIVHCKTIQITRKDGRVAMDKNEIANALGVGHDFPPETYFEGPDPQFRQYVSVKEDYDTYYIKPKKGWAKQPTLDFFVHVRKAGNEACAIGTYTVDTTADDVAVEVVDSSSCWCFPSWRRRGTKGKGKKGEKATSTVEDRSKPLLVQP